MLIQLKYIACFFALGLMFSLNAQTGNPNKKKVSKSSIQVKQEEESPYSVNLKNEIPYFATSLGLLGSGLLAMNKVGYNELTLNEINSLNPNNINSFDRPAIYNQSNHSLTVSDIILYSTVGLPLCFLSTQNTRKDIIPLLVLGAEVFSITNTLTLNTKFLVSRTRPLAYNNDFTLKQRMAKTNKLSFFSGHTAQTSALFVYTAKVLNDYNPGMNLKQKLGLWTVALGCPAFMGYLRVKGGKHFSTDVIFGYGVGAAIGWLVPHLHKKKSNLSVAPYNYGNANGISLTLKLN